MMVRDFKEGKEGEPMHTIFRSTVFSSELSNYSYERRLSVFVSQKDFPPRRVLLLAKSSLLISL